MENFVQSYTQLNYRQLFRNIQNTEKTEIVEIPRKKIWNYSMASILEPEVKQKKQKLWSQLCHRTTGS